MIRNRRSRRKQQGGQAFLEFCVILPMMIVITFGVLDVGRAVDSQTITSGQARAGINEAVAAAADLQYVSQVITTENTNTGGVVPSNCAATWTTALCSGGANDCGTGHLCGDTGGCAISWFAQPLHPTACWTIGYCTIAPGTTVCDPNANGSWGVSSSTITPLPGHTSGYGLVVKVVLAIAPLTPVVGTLVSGNGGVFVVSSTAIGVQKY